MVVIARRLFKSGTSAAALVLLDQPLALVHDRIVWRLLAGHCSHAPLGRSTYVGLYLYTMIIYKKEGRGLIMNCYKECNNVHQKNTIKVWEGYGRGKL